MSSTTVTPFIFRPPSPKPITIIQPEKSVEKFAKPSKLTLRDVKRLVDWFIYFNFFYSVMW